MKHFVTSLLALALAGAGSLIGCSDDSNNTTGGGNNGGAVALDDLGTKTAELYCSLIYSCCTMAEQAQLFEEVNPKPTNDAECVQTFATFFDGFVLGEQKKAVAAGRLGYDGELVAKCIPKLKGVCSAFEDDLFENDAECSKIFVGKVADGGDCANDDECAGANSVCVGDSGDNEFGKCQPRGAVGAACDFEDDCTTGYCDYFTNACGELKAIGEACTGSDCKDSYCNSTTSVCTAKKADGAACSSFEECTSDECDTETDTCVVPPVPAPICDGM
ncbi:MAG TPA: hypothetical protein VM694_05165 [Polyangium sp.]|nr:hypothetical protein [Polyangium sp.]